MKNTLFGVIVAVLVVLLWYTQLYQRWEHKAAKAKADERTAQTSADNLRRTLDATSPKKTNKADVSTKTLLAALPNDPAEAAFLRQLDQLQVSTGIAVQTVTAGVPAPGATTSTTVSISVQGSEDQVARYMTGLAALDRIFVLDSVVISPNGSNNASGGASTGVAPGAAFSGDLFSASLTGRVFSQGSVTPTAAAGTGATGGSGAPAPTGGSAPTGVQNG